MIRTGQFYTRNSAVYLLAQVDPGMVALIDISNGNRKCGPVGVEHVDNITEHEWVDIAGTGNLDLCDARIEVILRPIIEYRCGSCGAVVAKAMNRCKCGSLISWSE